MGRNGAGKSNVLKAIQWACTTAAKAIHSYHYSISIDDKVDIQLAFKINGNTYIYRVEHCWVVGEKAGGITFVENLSVETPDGTSAPLFKRVGEKLALYTATGDRELDISDTGPAMVAIKSLLPDDDSHRRVTDKIVEFFSSVRYYPLTNYDDPEASTFIRGNKYTKAQLNNFSDVSPSLQIVYKTLLLQEQFPEKFEELIALLGPKGIGLLNDIVVTKHDLAGSTSGSNDEDQAIYFLRYVPAGHLGGFGFDDLSFGTKRIVSLFTSVLYDSSSVCLVEQPEDGVHLGLLDKVTPLLKTYSIYSQFVFTTHSPAILNRIAPEEVFLVSLDKGETKVRPLSSQEISAAENYMKDDGPLADFLESIEED